MIVTLHRNALTLDEKEPKKVDYNGDPIPEKDQVRHASLTLNLLLRKEENMEKEAFDRIKGLYELGDRKLKQALCFCTWRYMPGEKSEISNGGWEKYSKETKKEVLDGIEKNNKEKEEEV